MKKVKHSRKKDPCKKLSQLWFAKKENKKGG